MEVLVSLIFVTVQAVSVLMLSAAFIPIRYPQRRLAPWFAGVTIFLFCIGHLPPVCNFPLHHLISIAALSVLICVALDGTAAVKLLCAVCSYAVLTALRIFCLFAALYVLKLPFEDLRGNPNLYTLLALLTDGVQFCAAYLTWRALHEHRREAHRVSRSHLITVLAMPVFTVLTMIILLQVTQAAVPPLVLIDAVIMLLANVGVVLFAAKTEKDEEVKRQYAALQDELTTQAQQADTWQQAHAKQRKITHDFRGHLAVLHGLLEQGQTEQAREYIAQLTQLTESRKAVECGNPFISALLNQKHTAAHAQHTQMEFVINNLSSLPVADTDMVVILSNLIDNAQEACNALTGDKKISVKMLMRGPELQLTVGNTAPEALVIAPRMAGLLPTTKPDAQEHGFGLQNVCEVLQRYGSVPMVECEGGWFQFSAEIVQ